MLRSQSSHEFHIDFEIEKIFKSRRNLLKSKTNPCLEHVDPNFAQNSSSNKTSSNEGHLEDMASNNNNTIDMANDKDRFVK